MTTQRSDSQIPARDPLPPAVVLDARVVSGTGGGPDKTILNSPKHLIGRGYRMLCGYMYSPLDPSFEQIRERARRQEAPLLAVADRGPWDWRVLSEFLAICRREQVAIWHGHDYKSNLIGLLLRPFWPMKLVTTVHGWVQQTRRTPLYYGIDRLCLPHYERVICVSPDLHASGLACGVPADRCVLIENGIDTARHRRRSESAAAKVALGIPGDRIFIGAVGRLSAEKGFDILIQAASALIRRGSNIAVQILGEGDERPRLEALIQTLGLTDRIHLLGFQADPMPFYEAMDILALSSHREGLPNVLLEAMALGVPVVATRIAGIPRLIQHEQNGLLIEPGAAEELAGALDRLVQSPTLRANLGQVGRATVEARYSFAERMETIATLYDDLLGRPTVIGRLHPILASS